MKAVLGLLLLGPLVGCAGARALEGPVGIGQTAYVSGPRVRPDHVIEDSRCPVDAQCVWEGRLVLHATVLGGGWSKAVDLTLGTPVRVADGALTLTGVSPAKVAGEPPPEPESYRFTFVFEGGL